MTETKYFCDHCGKELNLQKDYDDIDIDIGTRYITMDLCSECMDKLKRLIGDFVNKDVTP